MFATKERKLIDVVLAPGGGTQVSGDSGSGKSVFLLWLIVTLCRWFRFPVLLIDPKGDLRESGIPSPHQNGIIRPFAHPVLRSRQSPRAPVPVEPARHRGPARYARLYAGGAAVMQGGPHRPYPPVEFRRRGLRLETPASQVDDAAHQGGRAPRDGARRTSGTSSTPLSPSTRF